MSVSPSIQEFLRRADVAYTVLPHPRAYTAKQEAAAVSVPERFWAKVVTCFADGEPVQAVVPADCDVDFRRFAGEILRTHLQIQPPDWLATLIQMPPTGRDAAGLA